MVKGYIYVSYGVMSIEKSIRRLGIVSVASIAPALWVVGRAQVSSLSPIKIASVPCTVSQF